MYQLAEISSKEPKVHWQHDQFSELVLPHISYLYNYAYSLAHDRSLAEDLRQETLLIAFAKLSQLRDISKCRSWLFTILRNLFLGRVQKNSKWYFVDYDDMADSLPDHSCGNGLLNVDGFSDHVQHRLDRMQNKFRLPLMVKACWDYSYKEIACELDIPIGTVMSRIHRAKSFMRNGIKSVTTSGQEFL